MAHAERAPDAIALVAPGRAPLTYGRLARQLDDLVSALAALGVAHGDRIALALPQGPELAVAAIAVAAAATCAPLNPAHRPSELDAQLSALDATALIITPATDAAAREIAQRRGLPVLELSPVTDGEAGRVRLTGAPGAPAARRRVAQPDDVAFVLLTSGTTSRPKTVPLTHANVCASARNIEAALNLAGSDRCLNVMPLFHVHGLMATLTSLLSGASVVIPPTFEVTRFFDWMDECRPTWYTAVPPIHRAVLDRAASHAGVIARRPLRFIRSSSATLPPRLAEELERVFAAPVIESYGMTEAAHQITSNPLPPGKRKRGSVGVAAGPEVAIVDDNGHRLGAGETGEIVIRGAQVMHGYAEAPTADTKTFTHGWLRTGDEGFLDAEGYLFITGRLKDIINRGGEKIAPGEIDDVLLQHPAVVQAVTFSVPHPTLGEDVAAAVVLNREVPSPESALRKFVASRLALFKVPGRVVIVNEIPLGATGKVDRKALAGALGLTEPDRARSTETTDGGAPPTPTEALVAAIWGQVLGLGRVGIHQSFFALGGDSIRATLIASRVRDALHVELPLRSFFESPTVAGLVASFEEARGEPGGPIAPLVPVPRHGSLPLSFDQQRLWFLDQLEPGGSQYTRATALRLTGRLDLGALEQSLAETLRRHEALRTVFPAVDGQPRAVSTPAQSFTLPVVDLREGSGGEREARAERLAAEEALLPFDLARGPLFRATVLRVGDEDSVLLLTMHHIVSDGWSTGVLHRELTALYRAFSSGQSSPLPELPIQYADYAVWQRQWLEGDVLSAHLRYWTQQLAGRTPRLELPADRRRREVSSGRGAKQAFELPALLTEELKALSRREHVTLFMTLLAAFQALLHRYTDQEDIAVGSPVAGRTRGEIEELIGVFANTLVLRTDVSGDPTFLELLGRVRDVALGAYRWQALPFDKLVEALDPERGRERTPLLQVVFALQNAPASPLALPGLTVRPLETKSGPAKFDLTVSLTEAEGGLRGEVEYDPDLFDDATAARMVGHFRTVLEGVVADPGVRVSCVPVLGDAERQRLLVEWNATAAAYPGDASLPELFEAQAARQPEAVAVVAGDERVSYGDLNRWANQLAHRLRGLGVGPDVLVGICVDRSVEMVVGLLGVLKAGGAYMPLDPASPRERLSDVLADARVEIILTKGRIRGALPPTAAQTICLDTDWRSIAREPDTNPGVASTADQLAYVMYTSGSTGRPKGVAASHRGVVRLLFGQDYVKLDAAETLLQLAPLVFDASTFELWGALLHGGRCVLFPAEPPTPARLGEVITSQGVTTLWLTATLFNGVIDEAPAALAPIRQLVIGGEALSVPHVQRALERLSDTDIVNGYGPTEGTTFTCCYRIPRSLNPGAASIPIGRPIANTEVYVVDGRLNPVPIGVPGELLIAGTGLARGYLHHPDLTAERFIPHPFHAADGARVYKTGDLVRYRADGNLEFLGRIDRQVKIRGFRVELGEIETVLGEHPGVRQVVVDAREDGPEGKRLVAYVVGDSDRAVSAAELRSFLKERLPEYMLPAAFVKLEAIPLTANGKIDHRALPIPQHADLATAEAFVAPRTPVEEALARIWAEVLGVERVGVHDGFFDLGGQSLLATRVLSRLRQAFRVEVPLRRLFDTPTVAELAGIIEEAMAEGVAAAGTGAAADPGTTPPGAASQTYPLSFAQLRLWFLDRLEPGGATYNISRAVRLRGSLQVEALQRALDGIVARHAVLRTTFTSVDGVPVQVVGEGRPVRMALVDLEAWQEPARTVELDRRLVEEARRPFELSRDPMLRATLCRLADTEHALVVTMHHIASDGWSLGVLFQELAVLYEAFAAGRPSPLAELQIQYTSYAVWQRQWLQGERLEAEVEYWRHRLAGAPPFLALPTDRPRPRVQSSRGARHAVLLPRPLCETLEALSRREGVTLFMTLLAGFQTLLHRHTGQDDIVVGSPIAGRTRPELEGLIGFFVNTLVLRTDLSGEPTFRTLLARGRESALEAYAHQELPFEKLVEELRPARTADRSPLVQVVFALQNAPAAPFWLPGLSASPLPVDPGTAKFDLFLSVEEVEDGLRATLEYNTDLFDAATTSRMLRHWRTLLAAAGARPEERISRLPLDPG